MVWKEGDGYVPDGFRVGEIVCVRGHDEAQQGQLEEGALYLLNYRYKLVWRRAQRISDGHWIFVRGGHEQKASRAIQSNAAGLNRVFGQVISYADVLAEFLGSQRLSC